MGFRRFWNKWFANIDNWSLTINKINNGYQFLKSLNIEV